MVARRLSAVIVAVAMIVGAYYLRHRVIDKPSTSAAGSTPGGGTAGTTVKPRLVCISELATACNTVGTQLGLAVSVEAAGTTLTMLSGLDTDSGPVFWLTIDPWPDLVDNTRSRTNRTSLAGGRVTVASTPVVIAGPSSRLKVLTDHCPALEWSCIGDSVGKPWGDIGGQPSWQDVSLRHPSPVGSAGGLAVFASALASKATTNALSTENTQAISSWANVLESTNKAAGVNDRPIDPVVIGQRFDLVAALASDVPASVATFQPATAVSANAVLVTYGGASGGAEGTAALAPALATEMGKVGWTTGPPLHPDSMPDAISMEAAQALWSQISS